MCNHPFNRFPAVTKTSRDDCGILSLSGAVEPAGDGHGQSRSARASKPSVAHTFPCVASGEVRRACHAVHPNAIGAAHPARTSRGLGEGMEAEREASSRVAVDTSGPVLIVKIGHYPLHHGGVGAIRSLGRLGVPTYAVTEDRFVPAAFSRYLCGRFDWPTTGMEAPEHLVAGLVDMGTRIGRPTILLPTDEEAAVLIAEFADVLGQRFVFPRLADPKLPRRLADKQGLYEMCVEQGIAAPWTMSPVSQREVEEFASTADFPVVAKNRAAYTRRRAPAVPGTTRIDDPASLMRLAPGWGEHPSVVLQEYLPQSHSRDWFVHGYFDAGCQPQVLFTGIKT